MDHLKPKSLEPEVISEFIQGWGLGENVPRETITFVVLRLVKPIHEFLNHKELIKTCSKELKLLRCLMRTYTRGVTEKAFRKVNSFPMVR